MNDTNKLSIPVAIIIAGVFIAFSIFMSRSSLSVKDSKKIDKIEPVVPADINIRAIDKTDHIRGSLGATLKLVEFSDPECPFCKRFHSTMNKVMQDYGKDGRVAWVYRHFPLDSLHPKARKESEALECAGELGGNDRFWSYLDRLMEITPSNNQLEPIKLTEIADYIKLDKDKFKICLNSGKYAKRVQMDVDDAISAGGRGTPYTVIITPSGKKIPIDGAMPYESIKESIEKAF